MAVASADRLHLEVVAEHQPAVTELLLEQPVDDRRRQRPRVLLVERRDQDVRGHDRGHVRLDRRLERHELDTLDPIGRMIDEG